MAKSIPSAFIFKRFIARAIPGIYNFCSTSCQNVSISKPSVNHNQIVMMLSSTHEMHFLNNAHHCDYQGSFERTDWFFLKPDSLHRRTNRFRSCLLGSTSPLSVVSGLVATVGSHPRRRGACPPIRSHYNHANT